MYVLDETPKRYQTMRLTKTIQVGCCDALCPYNRIVLVRPTKDMVLGVISFTFIGNACIPHMLKVLLLLCILY